MTGVRDTEQHFSKSKSRFCAGRVCQQWVASTHLARDRVEVGALCALAGAVADPRGAQDWLVVIVVVWEILFLFDRRLCRLLHLGALGWMLISIVLLSKLALDGLRARHCSTQIEQVDPYAAIDCNGVSTRTPYCFVGIINVTNS